MLACDIKFMGINVHGTCLISQNREHLYPRNIYAIRYLYCTSSQTIYYSVTILYHLVWYACAVV